MGSQMQFESFSLEHEAVYRSHLAAGKVLIFANSAVSLDDALNWLETTGLDHVAAAVVGKDGQAKDALIIAPKNKGEVHRDFSKGSHISKLAGMKSKFQPPKR